MGWIMRGVGGGRRLCMHRSFGGGLGLLLRGAVELRLC